MGSYRRVKFLHHTLDSWMGQNFRSFSSLLPERVRIGRLARMKKSSRELCDWIPGAHSSNTSCLPLHQYQEARDLFSAHNLQAGVSRLHHEDDLVRLLLRNHFLSLPCEQARKSCQGLNCWFGRNQRQRIKAGVSPYITCDFKSSRRKFGRLNSVKI